jgi:hypothetical protein
MLTGMGGLIVVVVLLVVASVGTAVRRLRHRHADPTVQRADQPAHQRHPFSARY